MGNSKTRGWLVVAALSLGMQGCANAGSNTMSACFEAKTLMKVARVDEKNHRVFAIPSPMSREETVNRLRSSSECFSRSTWAKDRSVSLFAHEKYAGYKDEPHITPYHKNNEWAKAYVGEFDGASSAFTRAPATHSPMHSDQRGR